MVELLRRIADANDATPAQIALAWLLAQRPWISPIPGTRKLRRNLGSVELALTANDLHRLDRAATDIQIQGGRYPEELEHQTNL